MKSFPSLWVQHLLFLVPYLFTALTCVTLWVVDLEEGGEHGTLTLRVAAAFNTTLFFQYLMGWLNPHYLKLGCGAFNTVVVAYLVWHRHFDAAVICMAVYNVPACLFVLQAVWVPSISEISPGLYVSNRGAATSRQILLQYGITHILDMSGSSAASSSSTYCSVQQGDETAHRLVRKSVFVNDFFWASQHSLDTVLEECLAFLQKSHQAATTTTANKKPAVILIHCSAGQSRSAAMAAYYLMVTQQQDNMMCYRDVYRWIRRRRPVVDIHSDHLAPLRKLHDAQKTKRT